MLVGTTAERVARNESICRDANERRERRFEELGDSARGEPLPFLCECPDLACERRVVLTLAEYEHVRASGDRFVVTVDHEECVVESERVARVLERRERYTIMEKVGEAGELAEELAPRGD
jgi:hypothetical protein